LQTLSGTGWFQSSPVPKDGCNVGRALRFNLQEVEFQSSPVPKDGCNWPTAATATRNSVSILTRPEGRVQHR